MTKVSIVIPCFNVGSLLDETVESACVQTHPHLEVILVDDGSTDPATAEAVARARERGVKVIRQGNRGVAAARNTGIRHAVGEYVLPLDADDLIDPRYAEEAAAVLDAQPHAGIVYCRAEYFGSATGEWVLGDFSMGRMLNQNVIFAAGMFRRADWAEVGGYPEQVSVHEDYGFWIRLLGLGRDVVRLEGVYFSYRRRAGQLTSVMTDAHVAEAAAEIFRENIDLYARYAVEFTEFRLVQWNQLLHWKNRYGRIENFISRSVAARRWLRRRR